jgi:hypothetical protein
VIEKHVPARYTTTYSLLWINYRISTFCHVQMLIVYVKLSFVPTKIKQRMYGECVNCKDSRLECQCALDLLSNVITCESCQDNNLKPKLAKFNSNEIVACHQWVTKTEDPDGKKSTVTVKDLETMSLYLLVDEFTTMLSQVRKHIFNIRHQYIQYRALQSKLNESSYMIHIDFAENYLCRYNREIQSVHFGGSHKLHCTPEYSM